MEKNRRSVVHQYSDWSCSVIIIVRRGGHEKTQKHGPHMTGPNADAAASCGDDTTLSQNTSLKGGNTYRLRKPPEGRFVNDSSCALVAICQKGWSITSRRTRQSKSGFRMYPFPFADYRISRWSITPSACSSKSEWVCF